MDSLNKNDVVITGVSGVFPKADNVEEFAEKLFSKENLLSSVPYMPCKLGKLNDLSKFDAEFFGFQPHRVNVMDPMARIILEKAYEAIIDSGNNPVTFKGKNCGVFVGIHFLETEVLCYEKIQKGASLAISRSFNANRISYWLGVHGPSFTVDSACSSTLLALEMGYKAITNGECESALVGGCHVCLHPALLLHLLKVGALNPNGESRVFDENAGGFCKAEAIGMFYLQKAKDAKRVYAKVINVKSNHDGSKPLFLSPHGPSQAKLLKAIYEESKIDVNSVAWIEAHATGTLVGDKQEVTAIDEVFKNRQNPLLIGSVKSNMGHAEAAAAVGSISKVLIAMETGFIPPNINISNVRKDIDAFTAGRMKVITDKTSWNGGIVGISGFGMGGANTHVVLKSFTKGKVNGGVPSDDLPRIVGVSGRTENAVQAFLNYLETSIMDAEFIALLHEIHSFDIPMHSHRAYIALSKDKLYFKKKTANLKNRSRPLWFTFSGFKSNINSVYEAFKSIPMFQNTVVTCDSILKPLNLNVLDTLENNPAAGDKTLPDAFCAVIIQIALGTLMNVLNLSPDNVIGESFGGLVYAYLDGSISLDEALKVAYRYALAYETDRRQELRAILEKEIKSKPVSSKWISSLEKVKEENLSLTDYLVNCLSNSHNVEEEMNRIPKSAIVLNFSSDEFSKSLNKNLKGESVLINVIENDTSSFNALIHSLGELYLLGKNPHFQKLYPTVTFPVSRSTKMIAPLVKWNHTVSWPVAFSSFQERMLSGERKVSVSLDDKAYSYISGHEIDSTVLYPGTGYLVLVWETFAMMHSKMYADLPVVIENVRFHKAVTVPRSEPITFSIMVQKGNGNFEILENSQMVASGRIYVPSNARKEMLNITKPNADDDEILLDGLDFYRYALVRNYNYKDAFRSIKKINSEGTRASIAWTGNWVAYLDGVLHSSMLRYDQDCLWVPVQIEKIVIDTRRHEEMLKSNPSELEIIADKNINVIQSGGVQVKNCVLRSVPYKSTNKIPLVQKYIFSPFTAQKKKLPMKDVVQLFAQCFMDSVGQQTKNVEAFEIIDEDSNLGYSMVMPFLSSFIKEQPLFNAKLTVFVENNVKLTKSGNSGYEIVDGKLPLGEAARMVICSQSLKTPKKLELITNSLTDDGFLLTREDSSSRFSVPFHLQTCGDVECNGERFILLRKKIKLNLNLFKIINVTCNSFDWIEELQESIKIAIYERIILVSEKEPYSGIIGFYNCLRLERGTENIRCYFVADSEIDSFSVENELFKSQLLKDLAINIYQNGEWGCYVKYSIDNLVQEDVQHAFVYGKNINGLKSSVRWCKGDITGSNESSENLIQVNYASVNATDVLLFKNRLATKAIVEDSLKQDYVLGMEFAGRTRNGKRFMGLRCYGCLSTLIERNDNDVYFNEVPKNWSLEDAATVPLAYYTVIYAMILCGKIKSRNTVLIHSAGGFIGQAAIHVAIYYNCNIFVTISSIDEKLFIKENFPYIADSKIGFTDSSFEHMIYKETNGKGVDVILNSLPDNKLLESVNCLAQFGRFVQIKKSDFHSSSSYGNKLLSKNASLHSAILEDILNLPKDRKIELKNAVDQHVQNGAAKPLARTMFCYSGIESAFEFASSSRNLGKCVIQIEPEEERYCAKTQIKPKKAYPRVLCDAEKVYIICGGLGGMGMELVHWLIMRGARKIIVTSRNGITKGSQSIRMKKWKALGAHVIISRADISDEEQTLTLLDEANSLGDVAGIFNLAAVLRDKMFKNQTAENFQICAKAKLFGTYNLDKFSRLKCPALKFFVVFSSIASGHGNLGQTNYGMCNSAVERICENRKANGLPALAIEWGAVGNVGMFVSFKDGNVESSYAGNHMQPIKSCLEVLDYSMNQHSPVVVSCVVAEKVAH